MPTTTLHKALLAAQGEMPAVKPDGENPHFKSAFVTLGHLIASVRPVLNKHGLAFAQFPSANEAGQPTLVTIILHESGEQLEYSAPLLLAKNDPQGQGSAITYMRRYALASALGISDQEDDDGNAGSRSEPAKAKATAKPKADSPRPATAKQKGLINALCSEANLSGEQAAAILNWLAGKATPDRLSTKEASEVLEALTDVGAELVLSDIAEAAKDPKAPEHARAVKIAERYLS